MVREVDRRESGVDRATPERRAELRQAAAEVSAQPDGLRLTIRRYDPLTGNPAIVRVAGALAGTDGAGGPVRRALDLAQRIGRVLGLSTAQASQLAAAGPSATSGGGSVVYLRQQYLGIPVFGAAVVVRFTPDGAPTEVAGRTVTITGTKPTVPAVSAQSAALAAIRHLATEPRAPGTDPFGQPLPTAALNLSGATPAVVAVLTDRADSRTVLQIPALDAPATGNLVWFPLADDRRLAWDLNITLPGAGEDVEAVVDAIDESVLYCCGSTAAG
jgi:Fungalysin/Thermolysin Propeptide Motif